MVGIMNLNHLKVEFLNDLPIESLKSHRVGIISQSKVFFFSNDLFKEFFLDSVFFFSLSLLLLKLLSVLALDKLKNGGLLLIFFLSRRVYTFF